MINTIQTVSVRFNETNRTWERVTQVTNEDGSTYVGLHVIPETAFCNYAKHYNVTDPDTVLGLVLHAPYVGSELHPDTLPGIREAFDAGPNKKPATALRGFVAAAGISTQYFPTTNDPLDPLRGAAREGVRNASEVSQDNLRGPGGVGSRSPQSGDAVERRSLGRRVADRGRSLLPGGRRRLVAGE